ncbi:hypothetical protein OPV22_015027 [Ensete ventricosum]|uniref:Uncharacterized protein n=1 Tax=Ensete ventricosum TaxID=4639 RepID=A0AAV8RD74_ENSVE|nr:hypothetical protein OPV22_015027 [Ensete ventricosum]
MKLADDILSQRLAFIQIPWETPSCANLCAPDVIPGLASVLSPHQSLPSISFSEVFQNNVGEVLRPTA